LDGPFPFVAAMAEVYFREARLAIFHDPLAAALLFEPSLCETTPRRIEVDLTNEPTLGRTRPVEDAAAKPHHVAHSVQVARFFEHYFAIAGRGA
jgi:purine nucleosidase